MKKLLMFCAFTLAIVSCKKDETPPNNNNNNPPASGCGDGFICFNLDGTDISKAGGGYELSDTNLFVKWEDGAKQLSIDIFGKTTGNYNVSDVRKQGNGRIYYFPDQSGGSVYFVAETGSLNLSTYDAGNKKVTGTFSGTLYNYDGNIKTFLKTDSVVIKDGKFTRISVPKI